MCNCNEPQTPPCEPYAEPLQSECLDCVSLGHDIVPVEPHPNYCADAVQLLLDIEANKNPCTLIIEAVTIQDEQVFVDVSGGNGTIEYSDNGVLFQLSPVFAKPQIDSLVVYFAREKNRPGCVATKTVVYDDGGPNECVPQWRDTEPLFTICIEQVRHKKQVDGCGGERFVEVLNDWVPTGRTRCTEVCSPEPVSPTIQADILTVCANATTVLEAIGGSGTIRWYNKNNLNASIGQGETFSVGPGTYVARSESACGTSAFSNEITIAATKVLPPVVTPLTYSLCGSQTTTINTSGGSAGTKKWYHNGQLTLITGDTYPAATHGTYYVVVENDCGVSEPSLEFGINYVSDCGCTPVPTQPAIQADQNIICGTNVSKLTATGGNGTIRWYRDSVDSGLTGTSITVQRNLAGRWHAVSVTACGTSVGSNSVFVQDAGICTCSPQAIAPHISTDKVQLCANQTAALEATLGSGTTIQWYRNGSALNKTGNFLSVSQPGTYTARYVTSCGESGDSNVVTITYVALCPGTETPEALQGQITWPVCSSGVLSNGSVQFLNLRNIHHYRWCGDTSFSCPANCDTPDGVIAPGQTQVTIQLPPPSGGTSKVYTIRFYRDESCEIYKDFFVTMLSLVCGQPDGTAVVITQPQCQNGALTTALVRLIGLSNVDRYRIHYGATFTGANNCESPDGIVPPGNSTADINLTAPAQNTAQPVVIRIYRDGDCSVYKDLSLLLVSPSCQCTPQPQTPAIVRVLQSGSTQVGTVSICGSETAVLQANGCNGTVKWFRSTDPQNPIGTGTNIQVAAGIYYAVCTTVCGNSGVSNLITVINTGPCGNPCNVSAPQISGGGTFCTGDNVSIQAIAACTGGTIRWRKGNVTLSQTGPTLTLSNISSGAAGVYRAICDLGNGCVSAESNSVTVTVSNTAPAAPTIAADDATICGTAITTLTASGTIGTVTWYRNGVSTGQTGAQITTQVGGSYTARNSNNCGTSADSNAVVVEYLPTCGCTPAPIPPTITPESITICGSQTTILTATGGNGVYRWYRNGIFFTGITGSTFVATNGGNYTATCTNSCGESVQSNIATVNHLPSCSGSGTNPSASLGTVIPPTCSGTQLLGNFNVYLNNVTNADRYEYCYGQFGGNPCVGDCTNPDGTLTAGQNIVPIPAPPQGQTQLVTIRIYNGTNCNSYLDIPVTLTSPNCQTLCALNLTNSGGTGVFDRTYTAAQTGTFYWKFDDYNIVDNLKIYRNGSLVVDTGYSAGVKVGSVAVAAGDSIRIVINATVATVGGAPNTNTLWEFHGNCTSAYTGPDCATAGTSVETTIPCHINLAEASVSCQSNHLAALKVRVRLNSIAGGSAYRHDTLRFSINDTDYFSPSSVSGTGVSDYAEYTFADLPAGVYTLYMKSTLGIIMKRTFAQINVPTCQ